MIVTFGNSTLPIHVPFHESRAFERVQFGAWGSGKSYSLCDEAIGWCLEQPGIRGMITRKTVPELRDTTEQVFAERVPPELWNAGDLKRTGGHFDTFTFPNGSQVLFRSIDDWRKHKSMNLGFIAWDEMTEFDEATYNGMISRLRQVDITPEARARGYSNKIHRRGSWGATNPEGKDWVYRMFHPESPTRKLGVQAFFSTSLDNPYLPPEYLDNILSMPKPWVMRYVLCQFDDFAGRIYDEFSEEHVVPHPRFKEGERPLVWMGMDPGTENPTAGLWVWVDVEHQRLVGIAEYEQPGLAVDAHVVNWRVIEHQQNMNVRWRVSDPNAITQRSRETMQGLDRAYAKLGYHFNMGASSDDVRIPQLGRLIHLRRFVLSSRLEKTIDAIRDYQWKDLTPAQRTSGEDPRQQPLKKNDHLVNAAQFLAGKMVPVDPATKRPRPKDMNAEIWAQIRQQQANELSNRHGQSHDLGGITV